MPAPAALLAHDPHLARRVPHAPILEGPTPVHPLPALSRELGGADVWIKRDDLTNPLYGGNKPRKLEFVLADALHRAARSVLAFGVVGSHHALATAIFARRLGLRSVALLVPGPVHPHGLKNLRRTVLRADAVAVVSPGALPGALAALARESRETGSLLPYVIPPGGSSPLGNLGYVSAALELAAQVRAGELPPPDYLYVPAGSLGTFVGLVVGLRLAGLPTHVVGVAVLPRPYVRPSMARGALSGVWSLLARHGEPGRYERRPRLGRWSLHYDQLGRGYGWPTAAGADAAALAQRTEGITLDPTYTAKAAAAAFAAAAQPFNRGRTILLWHTLSSAPVSEDLDSLPVEALPPDLHALVERRSVDAAQPGA